MNLILIDKSKNKGLEMSLSHLNQIDPKYIYAFYSEIPSPEGNTYKLNRVGGTWRNNYTLHLFQ